MHQEVILYFLSFKHYAHFHSSAWGTQFRESVTEGCLRREIWYMGFLYWKEGSHTMSTSPSKYSFMITKHFSLFPWTALWSGLLSSLWPSVAPPAQRARGLLPSLTPLPEMICTSGHMCILAQSLPEVLPDQPYLKYYSYHRLLINPALFLSFLHIYINYLWYIYLFVLNLSDQWEYKVHEGRNVVCFLYYSIFSVWDSCMYTGGVHYL